MSVPRRGMLITCFLGAIAPVFILGVVFDRTTVHSASVLAAETWAARYQLLAGSAVILIGSAACCLRLRREVQGVLGLALRDGHFDSLTGLPNRALFRNRLETALARAEERGDLVAAGFLDIDHFKRINDTLGHCVGDELLRVVGERLVNVLRLNDAVARLQGTTPHMGVGRVGGDEFAFLLTGVSKAEDVEGVGRRLLEALRAPVRVAGHDLSVTASIGVAIYPLDAQTGHELLRSADTAMYYGKKRGRNAVQFFSRKMREAAERKFLIEERLREAVGTDAFRVLFQPVRHVATGEVVAAEALLRWEDPELGIISPDEFVPVAEASGMMDALGQWVMYAACSQGRVWKERGFRPIRIAVNVSDRQLIMPDFLERVSNTVEAAGLSEACLDLEISESAMIENIDLCHSVISDLAVRGIGVALDNFGTGRSSLAHLMNLPVSRLKIDRSLVQGIPSDAGARAIVAAIVSAARHLGVGVVALGAESQSQVEALRALGCDEMQGFFFSSAVSADQFARFLSRDKNG